MLRRLENFGQFGEIRFKFGFGRLANRSDRSYSKMKLRARHQQQWQHTPATKTDEIRTMPMYIALVIQDQNAQYLTPSMK